MTTLLRGAGLATRLRTEITRAIDQLIERGGGRPTLVTLMVGANPSAEAYRLSIEKTVLKVGLEHRPLTLANSIQPDDLVSTLHELNDDESVTGVLVLMPLPSHLPAELVQEHLSPMKDVDGITPINAGRLHQGLPSLRPSTPQGGIELLDHYGIDISGKRVVVIGRSNVVGRPLASLMMQRDATVTLCHRKTVGLATHTRSADIVALAAGSPGLLTSDMISAGATVLDFGMNVINDKLVGDADTEGLMDVAGAVTPVPGGTGPVTALILARNTVAAGFAALLGSLDHVELVRDAEPQDEAEPAAN